MSNPILTGNEFEIEKKPGYWRKVEYNSMSRAKKEFKEKAIARLMAMGFSREQAILRNNEYERRFRR